MINYFKLMMNYQLKIHNFNYYYLNHFDNGDHARHKAHYQFF